MTFYDERDSASYGLMKKIKEIEEELDNLRTVPLARSTPGDVLSTYLMLPNIRGFVPFSAARTAFSARDFAANLYYNRYGNSVIDNDGLIPYGEVIESGGAAGWSPGSDHASFKILGVQGITVGAWVWFDVVNKGEGHEYAQTVVSKFGSVAPATNQRSYILREQEGGIRFLISSDGGFTNIDACEGDDITAQEWTFVVGRWFPSGSIDVWVDDNKTTENATQTGIFNSTAWLSLGSNYYGPMIADGARLSMGFVVPNALSDAHIENLWNTTRHFFGK